MIPSIKESLSEMIKRLPNTKLLEEVRRVLLTIWDPIRIQELPEEYRIHAQDEYDRYVGVVTDMLVSGRSKSDIENFLYQIEISEMGQKPYNSRSVEAVSALLEIGSSDD
jgi:hypothetical protein